MSYESSLNRLPNFLRYVNKVYSFSRTIESMQSKVEPETSPQSIFMTWVLRKLLKKADKTVILQANRADQIVENCFSGGVKCNYL